MSLRDAEKGLQVLRGGPDMSGAVLSRRGTADGVARILGILGILRAEHNASFVPSSARGCMGKGAASFWLGLGGRDKHMSVCQSVFPRPLRVSLKHKLGSLMNLFPSCWPLLQNDIVNQAKIQRHSQGRVTWPLCECRGTFNGECSPLQQRDK